MREGYALIHGVLGPLGFGIWAGHFVTVWVLECCGKFVVTILLFLKLECKQG